MSSSLATEKKKHLDSLVLLRGLAVLGVCFRHLTKALKTPGFSNFFFDFFYAYGQFGVHIFFIISGFVIPLSFYTGNYRLKNYFTFLYKRFLRLHPPYLLAVALTLVIMAASYKMRHAVFPENTLSIIKTIFYLHVPADNPVFWTLAIEAQYYLFIGLFYFLVINYPKISIGIFIPILVLVTRLPDFTNYVPLLTYLMFFLMGTVTFLIYENIGSQIINFLILVALFIYAFIYYEHAAASIAAIFACLVILLYKTTVFSSAGFIGTISYSMYLIHFLLGIKIINLLKGRINPGYYWGLFLLDFIIVVILSWLFYKLIEVPSENLSRKISYKTPSMETEQ